MTTYTYDDANRVLTETSPTNGVTTYTYDLDGELTAKTDPDGRTTEYAYDADGREITETWVNPNGGTPVNVVTTTYDAAGRVTEVQDDFSDYTYTYDAAGRVTSVDNAGTPGAPHVVLTYTYDDAGNRLSMGDNQGGTVGYTYDTRNELVELTQTGTGVDPERVDIGYDDAGHRSFLARYADLDGTGRVAITHYTYDNAERLTGITTEDGSDGPLTSYAYTLDPASRLTQEVRYWDGGASDDTITYGYTDNGQLTSVAHTDTSFANESYSYDANGNRTMTGYSTGTGNQLTSDGTYNYAYDAAGTMTSKTNISTGVETDYVWDFRDRLTEVDQYVNGVKTVLALYVYDALNNPIKVQEGGATRWTAYDGHRPVLDFDGSGTLTARYLQGPMVDEVLARDTPTGGVAWYLPDRLGTVRDVLGNSGAVLDHLAYNAYGLVLSQSNPSVADRFVAYAGLQDDGATGLDRSYTRSYDAAIGRWAGPDWSGFGGGDANLYRYSKNDPIDYRDVTGYDYIDINIGIGTPWTGPKIGPGGGVQFGSSPCGGLSIHPYFGVQSPGFGFTWAPGQSVTPGGNASVGYGAGGIVGSAGGAWGFDGSFPNWFGEVGLGTPGWSWGVWVVSPDINPANSGCNGNLFNMMGWDVNQDFNDAVNELEDAIKRLYGPL